MRTGDVTGDGISDVVVGADQRDDHGENHRGAAYVLRGGAHLAAGGVINVASVGATAFAGHLARIDPPAGATEFHFGATNQVADLDGNGASEVMIAATLNRAGGALAANGQPSSTAHSPGGAPHGRLYIAWDDNFVADPWPAEYAFDVTEAPGTYTEIRGGVRNRHFGEEIIGGEDWDGDGLADLFVGDIDGDLSVSQDRPAAGVGYIFYDAALLAGRVLDLDALPAAFATTTILGATPGDIAGDTATAGDFDADGFSDLAVASPHASPLGRASAGTLHVLHGQAGAWPAVIDLAAPLPRPSAARVSAVLGASGAASGDRGDTLAYSAAAGWIDADDSVDLIINEMLGNGTGPRVIDVGNLLVVSGALLVPEPRGLLLGLAAAISLWCLARVGTPASDQRLLRGSRSRDRGTHGPSPPSPARAHVRSRGGKRD